EDEGGDGEVEEGVKALLPLLGGLVVQIGPLHLADDLDAAGGEVAEKAQNLQGGAVDIVGAHEAPIVVLSGVEHFQLKPLDHFGQFDCRLRCHSSSSSAVPGPGARAGLVNEYGVLYHRTGKIGKEKGAPAGIWAAKKHRPKACAFRAQLVCLTQRG